MVAKYSVLFLTEALCNTEFKIKNWELIEVSVTWRMKKMALLFSLLFNV
jgi:hypothetical protein